MYNKLISKYKLLAIKTLNVGNVNMYVNMMKSKSSSASNFLPKNLK